MTNLANALFAGFFAGCTTVILIGGTLAGLFCITALWPVMLPALFVSVLVGGMVYGGRL